MFNHKNFILSPQGIKNFFWPINRAKVKELYKDMINISSQYFKDFEEDECAEYFEHLKIINMYFVLKISDLYQKKVIEMSLINAKNKNIDTNIFDSDINQNSNRYLDIVKNRSWPDVHKKNFYRKLRNHLATLIKNDGLLRRDLCDLGEEMGIVLTGLNPLASEFSKQIDQPIYLVKIIDFFPGANPEDIKKSLNRKDYEYSNSKIFQEYIEIFITILSKYDVELSNEDLSKLSDWHKEFCICINYYQNLLKHQPHNLPQNLWTSSAGILWNKLLAIEVRKNGGMVTGFDHAEGSTLSIDTIFPFIELQETDVFVTHSKTFIKYLKQASHWQLYKNHSPKIISVS